MLSWLSERLFSISLTILFGRNLMDFLLLDCLQLIHTPYLAGNITLINLCD
jgi:hypothetical protein